MYLGLLYFKFTMSFNRVYQSKFFVLQPLPNNPYLLPEQPQQIGFILDFSCNISLINKIFETHKIFKIHIKLSVRRFSIMQMWALFKYIRLI